MLSDCVMCDGKHIKNIEHEGLGGVCFVLYIFICMIFASVHRCIAADGLYVCYVYRNMGCDDACP